MPVLYRLALASQCVYLRKRWRSTLLPLRGHTRCDGRWFPPWHAHLERIQLELLLVRDRDRRITVHLGIGLPGVILQAAELFLAGKHREIDEPADSRYYDLSQLAYVDPL